MTHLLIQAFEKASKLSDELQDQLAQELMAEIEGEAKWDGTLARSQDKLEEMAEKAAREHGDGKTIALGFDEL